MTDTTRAARVPQRAARRRAEILEAARRLFAEHGVAAVTTNRIAAEAGVSPGNLYYWFPSKTELIRSLFAEWSGRMFIPDDMGEDAELLRMLWQRAAGSASPDLEYAFFLRELLPLMHVDQVLADTYRATYTVRRDQLTALAERLVDARLLHAPEPPTTVRDLVSLLWVVAETAPPFAELVGDDLVAAGRYGRAVIQPLLTSAGRCVLGLPDDPGVRS